MQGNAASDGSSAGCSPFLAEGCGSTVNWEMHPWASGAGRDRRLDPRPHLPGTGGGWRPAQVPPRSPAPPQQPARPRRHRSVGRGGREGGGWGEAAAGCPHCGTRPAAAHLRPPPTPRGSQPPRARPGRPGPHPPPTRTGAP